jgi:hypothetical protein
MAATDDTRRHGLVWEHTQNYLAGLIVLIVCKYSYLGIHKRLKIQKGESDQQTILLLKKKSGDDLNRKISIEQHELQ